MKDDYIPRLFDGILEFSLKTKGAVVVTGPKWCGKSETTKRQAKTIIDLMPRSTRQNIIDYAEAAPHEFLNDGDKPMLIDEWQHISFIWDDIKVEVDNASKFGLYILTLPVNMYNPNPPALSTSTLISSHIKDICCHSSISIGLSPSFKNSCGAASA